ncbi:c-type cytochrome [Psychrobacter frigidicola]|uniref:c-type cytochrome n=1 Tax=Psychrobacter frigidicola TaxID=45611 RepID=UPI0019181F32|nr:c-type cytochrome [Psychrobacter frigidicola]
MSNNQQAMNKKSLKNNDGQQVSNTGLNVLGKLTWSTLGLSAVLALSACSGGDNTAADETAPVSETETTVVEVEEPTIDAVPAPAEETVPVVETLEMPADDGDVVETDAAAEPEVLAADAGKQLYETQCHVCHATGLLEAPKLGNKEDWAPHLVKDIDTLHMHSAKGFNKMPAQANADVSEAHVHAAVDYMVAAVS